ncbi:hypothetical protein [Streptomyces sp. NPDC048350]|uniref:hypothetical protein n=1 Tax=Streptomyces sp. NPDC048350 TaxID=3365538 RepID=UPI003712FCDC
MPATLAAPTDNGADEELQASFGDVGTEPGCPVEGGEAVRPGDVPSTAAPGRRGTPSARPPS